MDNSINISSLVKKANDKTNWKARLEALNEIKDIDCQQRNDVVIRLAIHDKVYKVKHAAFLVAQELKLTKAGKPISLGKKDIGYTPKDFTKVFTRIKRESNMVEFDLEQFIEKLKQIDPEMYDVMEYEKGLNFSNWLKSTYVGLPKK